MALREYVADFFPARPRADDEPILSVSVRASGQIDAHEKAAVQAQRKGVTYSYVTVKEAKDA